MSHVGDSGEITATYRPLGEVETLHRPAVTNAFVATGAVTGGRFGLFEYTMRPHAGGPDAHFHKTFSESFYVVEGTVRLFDGQRWVDASAGDFLFVPEGGIHAFGNHSDAMARMLILFAPAPPREDYFRELAELADSGRRLTAAEYTEFLARHDQYLV